MSDPVVYRQATSKELDEFVVRTWVTNFKTANAAGLLRIDDFSAPCGSCRNPVPLDFKSVMTPTLRDVLNRPGVRTWVVANPEQNPPLDLHGFVVMEEGASLPSYRPPDFKLKVIPANEPMVHFIYVKRNYRGFGLARRLMEAAGVDPALPLLYSCKTSCVASLERAGKIPSARWAPLSPRFSKTTKENPR